MNLTELKQKTVPELLETAREMGIDNLARSRKQDIIFAILKKHAKSGEDIYGDGVLEILQDGFGFLRSADSSYLAGPDDIYVSPSQIRRFNLRKGDSISGKIRPPKEGERYFALLKVSQINFDRPENAKHKILFENLTPLFPQKRLRMEIGNGSTEDLTARIIDLTAPIGKGQRGLLVSPPKAGKTLMLQNIATSITRNRSEERRVGKECRSRWSPHHEKKNRVSASRGCWIGNSRPSCRPPATRALTVAYISTSLRGSQRSQTTTGSKSRHSAPPGMRQTTS